MLAIESPVSLSTGLSTTNSTVASLSTVVGSIGAGVVGAPVAPTLVSPVGGGNASGLNFTVSGYSHPSGVTMDCVLIETATNTGFTTSVQRSSVVPGGLTVTMAARTPGTTVYWRAKFIDRLGGESAWSSTGSFVAVAAVEYIGSAVGGNTDQSAISKSITGSVTGDLLFLAAAFNNGATPTTPAGWTRRIHYTDDPLNSNNMAIYTTVATSNNQSVSIAAYAVAMAAVRGTTDYISVDRNTIENSTLNTTLTINSLAVSNPCLVMGFDRASSTNTFPVAYSPFVGVLNGGAYFSQIVGFASSATGGTWSRTSNTNLKATTALFRLQ